MIDADIHILHESDFYTITDYKCSCDVCSLSAPEYNKSFSISFVRQGFFEYRVFRRSYEAHIGKILISKPNEHRARHIDDNPDIVTAFDFKNSFFEVLRQQFLSAGW